MTTILMAGCGNMGFAMLGGWIAAAIADGAPTIHVVEPSDENRARAEAAGAIVYGSPEALPEALTPDVVILAVKPQIMGDVLPAYTRFGGGAPIFLSIAAGLPIAFFDRALPAATPIIRCMPNTPAAVGAGMSVCASNPHVGPDGRALARRLLSAVGVVAFVEFERQLDAVTAISGSGPAYVFHMIEALTEAGAALGLERGLAAQMATQTVFGAGLLAVESGQNAEQLRRNVTSPGGTTAAGLAVLMREPDGLRALMAETAAAARARSEELARS